MNNSSIGKTSDSSDIKSQAKAAVGAASENMKSQAQDVANTISAEASSYADRAKDVAADEVKGVASALRTAANEMRSGSAQERTFSQIADSLADASDALHEKDLGDIVGSLNDFAKRNPLVFLGSAALIGFAATRFAKASGDGARASRVSSDDPHSRMSTQAAHERASNTGPESVQSPEIHRPIEGNQG